MMNDKQWRYVRIAANIIYKNLKNVDIHSTSNDTYDFLVTEKETGLRFGVKAGSYSFTETAEFNKYVERLCQLDFKYEQNQIPIIVLCVNDAEDKARFGFVVAWHRARPTIYKKVSLSQVSDKNWSLLEDKLKSMDSTIRILSDYGLKVIKTIKLSETGRNGHTHYADFVYLRDLTPQYKMTQKEVKDEIENFKRMVYGIPEEEYPSDEFDSIILEVVKRKFPSAEIKSKLMLTNVDLRGLQHYANNIQKSFAIQFEPQLNGNEAFIPFLNGGFSIYNFNIDLFVDNHIAANFYIEQTLLKTFPFEGWLQRLEEYKRLRATMHSPRDFFV